MFNSPRELGTAVLESAPMFTYIDPTVRQRLSDEKKIVRINARGELLPSAAPVASGELVVNLMGPIPLPLLAGEERVTMDWYVGVRHTELSRVDELARELTEQGAPALFASLSTSMAVNSVLIAPHTDFDAQPLVRVHSSCLTGDVFGSARCECGPQLSLALEKINAHPAGGVLVYMAGHEGRGIGLWAKAATYLLQDAGEDTYQANESLGLPADSRDFSDAAALLHYFTQNRAFRLLSNNPVKLSDLKAHGLTQITPEKHVVGVGEWNRRYLAAKRDWGHKLDDDDLG